MKEACVECADGEWALDAECWCCEVSGEYYRTDDTDPVVIRGMNFHEDVSATDIAEALNAEPDVRYSGVAEVKDGECVWIPAQTELVLDFTPLGCEAVVATAHREHTVAVVAEAQLVSTENYERMCHADVVVVPELRFPMRGPSGTTVEVRESSVAYFESMNWVHLTLSETV